MELLETGVQLLIGSNIFSDSDSPCSSIGGQTGDSESFRESIWQWPTYVNVCKHVQKHFFDAVGLLGTPISIYIREHRGFDSFEFSNAGYCFRKVIGMS